MREPRLGGQWQELTSYVSFLDPAPQTQALQGWKALGLLWILALLCNKTSPPCLEAGLSSMPSVTTTVMSQRNWPSNLGTGRPG